MNSFPNLPRLPGIAARTVSVLILLAIFISAIPVDPVQAATDPGCAVTYRVRSGQTLKKIAAKYGITVKELSKANDVLSEDDLRPGMLLCIPGQATGIWPAFTASITEMTRGYRLTITGSNFSKNQLYYVRLFSRGLVITNKVTRIKADKDGQLSGQFFAKRGVSILDRYSASLTRVCLKNARTDDLICQTIRFP